MKAIQFKKTGTFTGNDEEIQALFGGHFCYMGKGRLKDIEMYFERGSQSLPIRFDDWIIDLNGVILVLDGAQYQALVAETASARKQTDDQKQLGQMIHDSIRSSIKNDQQRSGLLAGNKFAEGGYIKPPYIIEMENQIKALSMMVSALSCRIEVLDSKK